MASVFASTAMSDKSDARRYRKLKAMISCRSKSHLPTVYPKCAGYDPFDLNMLVHADHAYNLDELVDSFKEPPEYD
jgi:hypothetical protein